RLQYHGVIAPRAGRRPSEAQRVAQLDEVLARVRPLDAGVGEVLQPHRQLMLALSPEAAAEGEVVAGVERRAEALVAAAIDRQQDVGADARLEEPAATP